MTKARTEHGDTRSIEAPPSLLQVIPAMEVSVIRRVFGGASASGRQTSVKTRRDQIIARRIQTTFDRDLELAGVSGLHAYVQNSEVTLHGSVRSDLDRELIVSITKRIPGVRSVSEHLQLIDERLP